MLLAKYLCAACTGAWHFDNSYEAGVMKISLVSVPVRDPVKAHEIYTTKLGFVSKQFDADANLAIVVSAQDLNGTTILLEPCLDSFAESYQKSAYQANLPIIVFSVENIDAEFNRLETAGVKLRPDLDRPEWGLKNMFEDGCGNIIMLEETHG